MLRQTVPDNAPDFVWTAPPVETKQPGVPVAHLEQRLNLLKPMDTR
jgi:hypothetical protein